MTNNTNSIDNLAEQLIKRELEIRRMQNQKKQNNTINSQPLKTDVNKSPEKKD